jgi:cytoskeletal protein CcmA (bactofilin family)
VECIHCGHVNEISPKAISATCTGCRKAMRMDELRIKDYQARRVVETCSTLTVESRGDLRATTILCNGAILRGKSTGEIKSKGPIMIGPEAEHTGNVSAPTIAVPAGAILEGFYRIGPAPAQKS